jgi:uncharacterized membrane protein YgcG
MRRTTVGLQLLAALSLASASPARAQDAQVASAAAERWTSEELENLLAPIALYPDPILAQVLVAATYPDQVLAAQAHVKAFGTDNIDQMPWEISVKAVARYTPVLNLLAEGEDWMTALGQAYASQPVDVMNAVQGLRQMANAQGNLQSTAQQTVVVEREVIRIEPAEPRVIYVPTYDPTVIYYRPVYVTHAHPAYWSWGIGYPVGVWLTYDVDWYGHRVYHHGWHSHGPRWVVVSRPWIVVSPFYVSPRHTVVVVNHGIAYRRWDAHRARRYSTLHRHVTYDRHDRGFRRDVASNRGTSPGESRGNARGYAAARNANGARVTPLPSGGAPSRGNRAESTTRGNSSADEPRGEGRSPARADAASTPRSSNGTWNPRPTREAAVPARAPRAQTQPSRTPSEPRASAPRSERSEASPTRSNGSSTPRASAPRASGSSAPRASAPRSSGSSAPRASAPRSGGSEARGSSAGSGSRGSGGSSGSSGKSGGGRSEGRGRGGN